MVVVTHQRKSGGKHGEAVRGASALTGAVDVVLELERTRGDVAPTARVPRAESRFDSTPEELALELGDKGYADCGTEASMRAKTERTRLAELLGDEPQTAKQLAEAAEIPEATARRRLGELVEDRRARRVGEGKRGSPYEFLSATVDS